MHDSSPPPSTEADDYRWLRSFAGRLAASPAEADDLAHDAWLVAQQADATDVRSRPAWLWGLVRNRHRMRVRGEQRRRKRQQRAGDADDQSADYDRELHRQRVLRTIVEALDELDEADRQLVLDRYCEDHGAPALAERLGVPASTVRSRLSRATARVRRILDERWEGGRAAWAPAVAVIPLPNTPAPRPATTGWKALVVAMVSKKLVMGGLAAVAAVVLWFGLSGDREGDGGEGARSEATDEAPLRPKVVRGDGGRLAPNSVCGEVQAEGTNRPLAGAVVLAAPLDTVAGVPRRAMTDTNGEFCVETWAAARYRVTASARGRVPVQALATKDDADSLVLRLAAGGSELSGQVSDIDGDMAEGVTVVAKRIAGNSAKGLGFAAVTDDAGQYAMSLPKGRWRVEAGGDHYTRDDRVVKLGDAPGRANFRLIPGATISGVVVTEDGVAVAGATVGFSFQRKIGNTTNRSTSATEQEAVTDGKGRFELRALKPGRYALKGSAEHLASWAPAYVYAGIADDIDGVKVTLRPAFNARGRVVDQADPTVGVAGARLFAKANDDTLVRAVTDSEGYFELVGLSKGQHRVKVSSDTMLRTSLEEDSVTIEDADVEGLRFELGAAMSLRGQVTPPMAGEIELRNSASVDGFAGLMMMERVSHVFARISPDGSFTVERVPQGQWEVIATGDDGSRGSVEVEVGDTSPDAIEIALAPRGRVRGRVLDDEGNALVDATVTVRRPAERASSDASVAADGSFELLGLEPGRYEVTLRDERSQVLTLDDGPAEIEVTLDAPQDSIVLRATRPAGTIVGAVVDEQGQPIADAWVTLRSNGATSPFGGGIQVSKRRATITDVDGRFEFDGVTDRSFDVTADGPQGLSQSTTTAASPGGDVELVLERLGTIEGVVMLGDAPATRFSVHHGGHFAPAMQFADEQGRFEIPRLRAGDKKFVVKVDEGVASQSVKIVGGEVAHVKFELVGWGSVRGRLVSASDGEPVAGVTIAMNAEGGRREADKMLVDFINSEGPTSGADGRFALDGIGGGSVRLMFHLGTIMRNSDFVGAHEVELPPGEDLDLGDIVVLPQSVAVDERGDLGLRAWVDEDGYATVKQVDPGGPAEEAGVLVGDRLMVVGAIEHEEDGARMVEVAVRGGQTKRGDVVGVTVLRDGEKVELSITAGAAK